MNDYFDFSVTAQDGSSTPLDAYRGKVLLIVNTATGCGFTPQYEDLERIYAAHHDQGLEILDFPCNQFAGQAPGTDDKIDVNGDAADPLFVALATEAPFQGFGKGVKAAALSRFAKSNAKKFGDKAYVMWNFTKFLVGRDGRLVARFEPTDDMADVERAIEGQL
jgi:glutathione peroxidase